MIKNLKKDLAKIASPQKARLLQGFFKTAKGQYGEGDVFLGIIVPHTRSIAKKYSAMPLSDVRKLLYSRIHEERLAAIFILLEKYKTEKELIFWFYVKNAKQVNNWDLVDASAPGIVGKFLIDKDKKILRKLAVSKNLWERRISIVATYEFIRNKKYSETFAITKLLLNDSHDLIHKAAGWMLREVGKKDEARLEDFLKKHSAFMPRTMLRYAIERFEEGKRKNFLSVKYNRKI